jgi:hypothetical protein
MSERAGETEDPLTDAIYLTNAAAALASMLQ